MPRITLDPELEVAPDFVAPHFQAVRDALMNVNQIDEAQAVLQLHNAWTVGNNARKQIWADQIQADILAAQDADRIAEEQAELVRLQREQEADAERREADKKKPKLNDFDDDRVVGDHIVARPAAFALNKLESFEYVELWYFTQEGCTDALEHQRTQAEDAYGLTRVDDILTLRPVSSFKAARNVIKDRDLSWRQMTMAKLNLIQHMTLAKWPDRHVTALANFFIQLEMSPMRWRPHGERILLFYQAKVRREWHDSLKRDQGFNIGNINDSLMRTISDEVWETIRGDGQREVSIFPSHLFQLQSMLIPSPLHPLFTPIYRFSTTRYTLHAARCTLHAARNHATRYLLHDTRYTSHASRCTLKNPLHASRCMPHATRYISLHAPILGIAPRCLGSFPSAA